MDENYLDNLLNEFSLDKEIDNQIEDELDDQIAKEKEQHQKERTPSQDDLFNMDLDQDATEGVLDQDFSFSEDQMNELDELGDLADLDIGDVDFSDIDFDDLDITKLDDLDDSNLDDLLKDFEGDLNINQDYEGKDEAKEAASETSVQEVEDGQNREEQPSEPMQEDLNEDHFDADNFLDSLIQDEEKQEAEKQPIQELEDALDHADEELQMNSGDGAQMEELPDGDLNELLDSLSEDKPSYDALGAIEDFSEFGKAEENQEKPEETEENLTVIHDDPEKTGEGDSLDDLFSLLDMDESEQEQAGQEDQLDITGELDALDQLENTEVKKGVATTPKKKSFMDILFGDDEELTDEQIARMEAEKAELKAKKKEKKQAEKEARKQKAEAKKLVKEQKKLQKQKEDAAKQKVKAEKRAKARKEEAENAEPEKKLNGPAVLFIFSLFLGGTFVLYLAANNFNYTLAIRNATKYFDNQKYHMAYDEIKGVDVKEKDQELKDRIYTVMYVERLYESYENNLELGFYDKALDSLLRGVEKYYEHYDEAVELGIESDINYSFDRIKQCLTDQFGISVERAEEINAMSDDEYVLAIRSYVDENQNKLTPSDESNEDSANTETPQKEDAITQEQQEEEVTQ